MPTLTTAGALPSSSRTSQPATFVLGCEERRLGLHAARRTADQRHLAVESAQLLLPAYGAGRLTGSS
jgi:hypothetical protein